MRAMHEPHRAAGPGGWLVAWVGLTILPAAGCVERHYPTASELDRGYILLLPGVEGSAWTVTPIQRGLREGGIRAGIEIVEWGLRPIGTLYNLGNVEENRRKAVKMAGRVVDYRAAHPGRPISVIGYSGGGGMALWAVEALPDGFMIDRLILIAPAVSPDYDLTAAMAHCAEGMVHFYSREDRITLGLGTRLFGTMDRVNTDSAGRIGFEESPGVRRVMAGLTQIGWEPSWRKLGHGGSHVGWLAGEFNRTTLAPWVFSPEARALMDSTGEAPSMGASGGREAEAGR